jgi:hypothetical protein
VPLNHLGVGLGGVGLVLDDEQVIMLVDREGVDSTDKEDPSARILVVEAQVLGDVDFKRHLDADIL